MGISMVLLYGCQYLFTSTPIMLTTQLGLEGVQIGAIRITWTRIVACGIALAAFGALWFILHRTQFGRAMRAVAINREAALMVGVKPRTGAPARPWSPPVLPWPFRRNRMVRIRRSRS